MNSDKLIKLSYAIGYLDKIDNEDVKNIVTQLREIKEKESLREEVRFLEKIKSMTFVVAKEYLTSLRAYETAGYSHASGYHEEYGYRYEFSHFSIKEKISMIKEILNQLPNFGKHDRLKGKPIKELLRNK